MGVITSAPEPVRLNYYQLTQNSSESIVVESSSFNNNIKYLAKTLMTLSNNKNIKKIVFKLGIIGTKARKLITAMSKLLKNKESVAIYGDGLNFFEDPAWKNIWANASIESLAVKDKLSSLAFTHLCQGIKSNTFIKDLVFKLLTIDECSELSLCLRENSTIKSLCIQGESRGADSISDNASSIASTNNSFQIYSNLLSENTAINTYTLAGYLEICPFLILGLRSNRGVNKMIFENVEIDREFINVISEVFKVNTSIKELEIRHGFHTSTAMTVFTGLRQNKSISSLKIQECTFSEGGFMTLKDFLIAHIGLKKLEIKDMLQMRHNFQDTSIPVGNFLHLIKGLTDNNFIIEAAFSVYISSVTASTFISPEIGNSLKNLLSMNHTLVTLKIEGFRLGGDEILAMLSGLKENASLKDLVLTGNLIEWKDLNLILDLILVSSTLKFLDLSDNKLSSYNDLIRLRGQHYANECLGYMKQVFFYMSKMTKCDVKISSWFWETIHYPKGLYPFINQAKAVIFRN